MAIDMRGWGLGAPSRPVREARFTLHVWTDLIHTITKSCSVSCKAKRVSPRLRTLPLEVKRGAPLQVCEDQVS